MAGPSRIPPPGAGGSDLTLDSEGGDGEDGWVMVSTAKPPDPDKVRRELLAKFIPQLLGCTVDSVLTREQCRMLHGSLPPLYQGHDFQLAYSTRQHGTSLQSLYSQCGGIGASILVVQDEMGRAFGGFSALSWDPSASKHYQGTGETYVFSFALPGDEGFKFWRWSRRNEYYLLAHHDMICFGGGGGGRFALHIDAEIASGSTGPCETFDSPALLPGEGDFNITALEVWYFPSMQDSEEKQRKLRRGNGARGF